MAPDPAATYCPQCGGLEVGRDIHVASRYHRQHQKGGDIDADVVRARMARDPEFATRVLWVEIAPPAPELRRLAAPPTPENDPPAAPPSPGDELAMDFDLLGNF